ncbi:MS18B protein, partial [Alcedo cyanopectus]|nr:MS18B protein [Ceyx cyanopectus]
PNEWTTFHCCGCWTVLGDSLHLCSQQQRLGILICLKVTKDVVWKKSLLVGLEGTLLGCTYYPLSCQSCGMVVGFILYSATRRLAYLRGFFCFFMDRILCYILKKQKTVRASKVNFPDENVKE